MQDDMYDDGYEAAKEKYSEEINRLRNVIKHCSKVMACAEVALILTFPVDKRDEWLRQLDSGEWLRRRNIIGERFDTTGRGMAVLNLRDAQKLASAGRGEG